eukprot:6213958-Pleurochrysis_carterae.AAC.2
MLAPWAREVVWDCADPANCVPVQRSMRSTTFEGPRQIDRATLRAAAAQLSWEDEDIVLQVGEGGVEVRSECEPLIVLTFHHPGLVEQAAAAALAVDADMREGWTSAPTRHLPFVPCCLQPRDVIMQARQRVSRAADGSVRVEDYAKPRVATDSSFGGIDAVNAGVADAERVVALPHVQAVAKALAIADTDGDASGGDRDKPRTRAVPYVADAESAYRFCPVQRADLSTQCFVWWGRDGRAGVVVDRRMGFGGAFAPNRFERVSTLEAAWVQRQQAAFDETQPLPAAARRWAARRAAAQQAGTLRDGAEQLAPRYLQVYIDDFTGVAMDDTVVPPTEVAAIKLDLMHTTA